MGALREVQKLEVPIKLGADTFFIELDVNPGATDGKEIVATVQKDDGTKKAYKGVIPTVQGVGTATVTITFTFNEIS